MTQENEGLQGLKNLEEKAKGSIARAESAGAKELSPELLDQAYLSLRNGQGKDPKTDGGAKREQYLTAIEKANQAYDEALSKARGQWLLVIDNYEADLDDLNAPLYMPEYDVRSRELLNQLRRKIDEGDNEEAFSLYQSTIPNVDAVVTALAANLDWLDQLRQEVTGLMGEASRQDLRGDSAKQEKQGRDAYDSAIGHRSRGDMHSMEQDLFDARYYLRVALRFSGVLDPERLDALLRRVQKLIETSSARKIVDSDGNEIEIEQWDGEAYLKQHPLVDLGDQNSLGERRREESNLQEPLVSEDFFKGTQPVKDDSEPISLLDQPGFMPLLGYSLKSGSNIEVEGGLLEFKAEWQLQAVTQEADTESGNATDSLDSVNSREDNPYAQDRSRYGNDGSPTSNFSAVPKEEAANSAQETEPSNSSQIQSSGSRANEASQEYVSDDGSRSGTQDLLSDAQLLLKQAISSWENGVQSRNKGNLTKAQHYFEESNRLIDQYNVQYAILGYYTVRKLKPEDCLWRIAGYSDIYGDPFQWTRIYQRNRDIINNPSLIYPGQRFVIPPAKD